MFSAGARACYVASAIAARTMTEQKSGLIVNISFWVSQKRIGNVASGAAKAATDKMARDMAEELGVYNASVVSLYPGLVRAEGVLRFAQFLDLSNSESPQFVGCAVASLACDSDVLQRTGRVSVAAQLAAEYGFAISTARNRNP